MENNVKPEQNGQLLGLKNDGFTIFDSAFACVIFIIMTNLFSVLLKLSGISLVAGTFVYYIVHAISELTFAVSAVIVVYVRKKSLVTHTGMKNKVNGNMVFLCFLASFVSLLGFGNLTNVFLEILTYCGYSSILGNIELNNFGQYIGMLFSSCLVAAFAEELLFRGVIQSGFKKWGIRVSVGISALIFMLMHGNAEQTVHQFIVGVLIGYVFYKTNNFWIGFLIHMFNNFIPVTQAFLLSLTTPEMLETQASAVQVNLGTILIDLIIAGITAWAGLYFLKMIFQENDKLNSSQVANENLTSIKVDGDETQVEMSIEGNVVSEHQSETMPEEKPKISKGAIILFALSGIYLVGTWILYTVLGFVI